MTRFSTMPIVVPIDFSEEADRAMEMALEIAADPANILAVHVAAPLAALEPGMVWEMASDEVRAAELEKAFRQRYAERKYVQIGFEVRFGDPGHEITTFAEKTEPA